MEWIQYGFDENGNRTWRENVLAPDSTSQDEAYQYDEFDQLTRLQRGVLNVDRSAVRALLSSLPIPPSSAPPVV